MNSKITNDNNNNNNFLLPISASPTTQNPPKKAKDENLLQKTKTAASVCLPSVQGLDLSKLFYNLKCVGSNWEEAVFQVPLVFLPKDACDDLLRSRLTTEDLIEGDLQRQQRLAKRKEVFKCPVYEVESLSPQKIYGMKSIQFIKTYGDKLENLLYKSLGQPIPKSQLKAEKDKTIATSDLSVMLGGTNRNVILHESQLTKGQAIEEAFLNISNQRILTKHKEGLILLINDFGKELFPHENTIWLMEILSLCLVREFKIEPQNKGFQCFLQYWEEINWRQSSFITEVLFEHFAEAHSHLSNAIKQLRNMEPLLDEMKITDKILIKKIKKLRNTLLNTLEYANGLSKKEELFCFMENYSRFMQEKLSEWTKQSIFLSSSQKYLGNWLDFRAEILENYVSILSKSNKIESTHEIFQLNHHFQDALKTRKWGAAYQFLNDLIRNLEQFLKPKKIIANGVYTTQQIALSLERDQYTFLRCCQFAESLANLFDTIIAEGKLFQPISEVAYEALVHSFQAISPPNGKEEETTPFLAQARKQPLIEWASALKDNGDRDLYEAIIKFKKNWATLKTVKTSLETSDNIKKHLKTLLQQIENQEYQNLLVNYKAVFEEIAKQFDIWKTALNEFNRSIREIQAISCLMLADPDLTQQDILKILNEFPKYNERIEELVKPVTLFFSAFDQLIDMEDRSEDKLATRLRLVTDDILGCYLFETHLADIDKLKVQLEEIEKSECLFLSTDPEDKAVKLKPSSELKRSELKGEISGIFQGHTKTRKIMQNVARLLKEHHVTFGKDVGKGDHNKLKLFDANGNCISITFPEHKEWKPGTLKSIQNELLKQLQKQITEKKK